MPHTILQQLISFKTVSKDKEEGKRAIELIKKELSNLSLFINEYDSNGFASIVFSTKPTKNPKVILQGHLDVVPGSEKVFIPKIREGRLYGRGAFDMKFAIASYIKLLKDLGKDNLKNYDIAVMITTDEELGGEHGVKHVLNQGYRAKVCVLPDGGENWSFQEGAKGVYHLEVEAKGKSAHGSRPWEGKNALEDLTDFLNVLRSEFVKEPCGDKRHYHNTLNVGKIEGGNAANKIPDSARALIDMRFTPDTKLEDLKKLVKNTQKKYKNITVEELATGNSYRVDKNNRYLKLFIRMVKNKLGIKPEFIFSHGSSDARFFLDKNIPTILLRPTGGNIHAEEEWIDVEDLQRFYRVLKDFVTKTGRINSEPKGA